uniref:Uncharacterized protein n=1 Tax=Strombidium inclinatum TaxID=197538 RepID=A0A7S3MUH7_9SPIT|mmetsp:Transcript_22032/g.34192  ORF Transcript_22032/g.34192 Transcript_22032/m.34192 type:complete len:136 (+) Transcript_22032:991-1398(+)
MGIKDVFLLLFARNETGLYLGLVLSKRSFKALPVLFLALKVLLQFGNLVGELGNFLLGLLQVRLRRLCLLLGITNLLLEAFFLLLQGLQAFQLLAHLLDFTADHFQILILLLSLLEVSCYSLQYFLVLVPLGFDL